MFRVSAITAADYRSGGAPWAPPLRVSGMTLLELMVVLVIIASVAASALVVTDRMVEQGWIEQTDRNLDAVVAAIDGGNRTDGAVSGFLADIGRLPELAALNTPPNDDDRSSAAREARLLCWRELVTGRQASNDLLRLPLWGLWPVSWPAPNESDSSDNDIKIPCGWRGPYITRRNLFDGWSGVLRATDASSVVLPLNASGQAIHGARSFGQDHTLDVVSDETTAADRTRLVRDSIGTQIIGLRWLSTSGAPSGYLVARLFAARNGVPTCIAQDIVDLATATANQEASLTLTAAPLAGVFAVRAYHLPTTPPTFNLPLNNPQAIRSKPVLRTIAPWTTQPTVVIHLIIP